MIIVGIDPGTDTGYAEWDVVARQLLACESMLIHQAMARVLELKPALVIFEDARQRQWLGNIGRERLQGAGSIKRDSVIWQDFLTDHRLPYVAHRPMVGGTKMQALPFQRLTKWAPRTNEHARDAAMLVYQMNLPMVQGMMRAHA